MKLEEKQNLWKSFVQIVIVMFVLGIPNALAGGYVFAKAWEWFVVPHFHADPIGIVESVGLSWLVGIQLGPPFAEVLDRMPKKQDAAQWDNVYSSFGRLLFFYPLSLLFIYMWHLFL